MLSYKIATRDEMGKESVSKILAHHRWENEVGVRNTHSRTIDEEKNPEKNPIAPGSQHDREVMMRNKEKRAKKRRGGKSLRGHKHKTKLD